MNLFVTVGFSVKQCNAQELDRTSNARKICRPIRAIPDIAAKKNESIHLNTLPERMDGLWQRHNLTITGLRSLLWGEWFDPEIVETMNQLTRILKYQNQYY